jgi:hypothetical protein
MENMLTEAECAGQVGLMARRTALLYHYFAQTLVEELGEQEGRRLIEKAIWAYGEHCGRAIREQIQAQGLPLTEENYNKIPDLPAYGWTVEKTGAHATATYCPMAAVWIEMGPEAVSLGRLYCHVDQAKQHAYNPEEEFVHHQNVLDGDPVCEFGIRPRKE